MGSLLVQFRLSGEELDTVSDRAKEHGFGSPIEFIRKMVTQLGDTVIEISNSDQLRSRYEGQVEILKDQVRELTDRLSAQSEKSGLNGVETKNMSYQARLKEELDKFKAEMDLKNLQKELDAAIKERAEYESGLKELEQQVAEMEAEKNSRTNELISAGMQMLASGKGLQGLFGGGGSTQMGALPINSEEHALGSSIYQDFPEENKREALKDVIRFFRDKPKMFDSFIVTKPFQAYLTQIGDTNQ
jgi:hypothetical protein